MFANARIADLLVRRVAAAVRWGCVLLLAVVFAPMAWSQTEPSSAERTPPDAASAASASLDVARLIKQLDDDEYRVRQEATRKLARGGTKAVGPLAKVAAGENLESAFRAFAALKELGCSEDAATEEAAFSALESLAGASSATAQRAGKVLVGMRAASQDRAKDRLRELGAKIVDNGNGSDEFAGPVFVGGGGVFMARGVVFIGDPAGSAYAPGTSVEIGEKWTGKADDLRLLRRISNVRQIAFSGEQVTDEWLEQLKHAPGGEVQWVKLRHTKVTDEGLAHLAAMPSLVRLDVFYTPITDKSVDLLATFGSAQYVGLFGTKITAEGASKLATKLPNARIDRRGGALLGVGGSIGEQPCVINTVQPDSAAAKAGILEGDVIVSFDGKTVQNFTELTAAISEKIGGEKVEIELLRPNIDDARPTTKTVTVTLGEW
ncbi:MAG: PDZ domain-containing protein [Pirellulales bacterium]